MKKILITLALLLSMIAVFASEGNVRSEILSARLMVKTGLFSEAHK